MKPIEMADELVSQSLTLKLAVENGKLYHDPVYEKAFVSYRLMRSAARTIRELERSDREVRDFAAQVCEANEALQDKLKIATEELEKIVHIAREMVGTGTAVDNDAAWSWAVGLKATSDNANQALARISEVV